MDFSDFELNYSEEILYKFAEILGIKNISQLEPDVIDELIYKNKEEYFDAIEEIRLELAPDVLVYD